MAGVLFCQQAVHDRKQSERTGNFPGQVEKVRALPAKHNLWVFLLAGQSNMAGRGFVEPVDTMPDPRILTVSKNKEWICFGTG